MLTTFALINSAALLELANSKIFKIKLDKQRILGMWRITKLSLIVSLGITLNSCNLVKKDDIAVPVEPLQYLVKSEKTIDGDTITIANLDDFSKEITVNLCGIKSPNLDKKGGTEAREALIQILNQAPGSIIYILARDDFLSSEYDNAEVFFLGEVEGEEQDIFVNAEMIRLGYASFNEETIDNCLNKYLILRI
jgi:endonuclease YncB( thermonuclease family)